MEEKPLPAADETLEHHERRKMPPVSRQLLHSSHQAAPANKKTVLRNAKTAPPKDSTTYITELSDHEGATDDDELGSEYDSDVEVSQQQVKRTGALDPNSIDTRDISNDADFDTDLDPEPPTPTPAPPALAPVGEGQEEEAEQTQFDHSGKTSYIEHCAKVRVIPISFYVRNMSGSELVMKHHGLGDKNAIPMAQSLLNNSTTVKLDLTDNWIGDGGRHFAHMLRENCFIQELDLSGNRLDHHFITVLADALPSNRTLTHLNLSANKIDSKALGPLSELIANNTRLTWLSLAQNRITEDMGKLLGSAIAENTTLHYLDLSWNSIRRKGAVDIAKGIKNNMAIHTLNLSYNGFATDGTKAISDALKVNQSLEELDLCNNRITTEGAAVLAKGLQVNETLRVLKIGRNPIRSPGAYAILAMFTRNPNSKLENVDLHDVLVEKDFQELRTLVKETFPDLKCRTGSDDIPLNPKVRLHPMIRLRNYIEKHNLRLIEFFNKFDKDGSMSVSHEEFKEGVDDLGIKLNEEEMEMLLYELDKDGDGEINYSELLLGNVEIK